MERPCSSPSEQGRSLERSGEDVPTGGEKWQKKEKKSCFHMKNTVFR